jgi:hypothetical protein
MNRLTKACAVLFVVVCFAAAPAGLALPKKPPKPPKPTPTPVPEPDPEIVYVCGKRRGNVRDTSIVVMNADGSNQTEVVDCGTMSCSWPDWSPDGSQIIFVSNAFDTFEPPYTEGIYVVNVDGSNLTKLIDLKGGRGQPAWSPVPVAGEHWIVYSDQAGGVPPGYHDLFAYGVDSDRTVQLTNFPDITVDEPAWSADGAFLSARHQWDLHPWHVYGFIFAVEEVTTGEEIEPALGPWLHTDHWNYNHWYYMDDDPLNNDNCGFGSTDWSNGQSSYPYMMLGMCGLEVTFRLDLDGGYPYVVYPNPDDIGVIPLAHAPVDLRKQLPPDILPIWVTHGRFSPDNSQFVFQGVIRDPNLKATGIYVASISGTGEVDELVKMRWPSSVESPEWRP